MVGHEWESVPGEFTAELRRRLGNERFQVLTEVCRKHDLFPTITNIASKIGDSLELRLLHVGQVLLNTGKWLCEQGANTKNATFVNDAVVCLYTAQEITTLHWAIGYLAWCYMLLGRTAEARTEAKRAIDVLDVVIDSLQPFVKNKLPPGQRATTEALENYRQMVCDIAEGRLPGK